MCSEYNFVARDGSQKGKGNIKKLLTTFSAILKRLTISTTNTKWVDSSILVLPEKYHRDCLT